MPKMDGLEVLRRLHAKPNSGQYKIIMLTGRKSKRDIVNAVQLGVDDYVAKPFNMQDLQARIRRLLQNG